MDERQSPEVYVLHPPPLILGSICVKFHHQPHHQHLVMMIEKKKFWLFDDSLFWRTAFVFIERLKRYVAEKIEKKFIQIEGKGS